MSVPGYYAHSRADRPPEEWHDLKAHLESVADKAACFAQAFGSEDWGRLAGLWHDVGKYQKDFQDRLKGEGGAVDHAVVGALLAESSSRSLETWLPLALAVAGHHAGLADLLCLKERLRSKAQLLAEVAGVMPDSVLTAPLPRDLPGPLRTGPCRKADREEHQLRFEMWIRFLFSAVVDADFLDTEGYFTPERDRLRSQGFDDTGALLVRLSEHLEALSKSVEPTPVNCIRAEVLRACRDAADWEPGILSLTAPTGSGKTLSAMLFSLKHAKRHGLRRVIVVLPYTSIIEQNAAVYREVLGEQNVIEHHSAVDPDRETERNQLASENWDAPVIVTTSVQFLESLFANRPSRCRKLHNVARSVIVLDEVQTLPSQYLLAILDGLNQLCKLYGCSVVLATATQPALAQRDALPQGLRNVREILPEPLTTAQALRRVTVAWPQPESSPVEWPALAGDVLQHEQVLVVVHRRRDARLLARLLPEGERFHLSALMCARHRTAVLEQVRGRLRAGRPCRLVSTQLVEAGVDIDFPVVYRALGGLDSIVQAAGRCNREGKLSTGRVVVFRAPTAPPRGTPQKGLESTESLLRQHAGTLSLDDPGLFNIYFRSLYGKEDLDSAGIQAQRAELKFETVADSFKVIEEGGITPVVVPYSGVDPLLDLLRREGPSRQVLRGLQPFLVNLYADDADRLLNAGALETLEDLVHVLAGPFHHLYSAEFGLVVDEGLAPEAVSLIA